MVCRRIDDSVPGATCKPRRGGWVAEAGSQGEHSLELRPGAAGKPNHPGGGLHPPVPFPSLRPQTGLLVNPLFASNWEVGNAGSSAALGRVMELTQEMLPLRGDVQMDSDRERCSGPLGWARSFQGSPWWEQPQKEELCGRGGVKGSSLWVTGIWFPTLFLSVSSFSETWARGGHPLCGSMPPLLLASSSYSGERVIWNVISGDTYCQLRTPSP